MTKDDRDWFWFLALVLCVSMIGFGLALSSCVAYAHDAKAWADMAAGDDRRGAWFDSLKQPGTVKSCCGVSDCYQTQARQLPDHSWEAVINDYKGHRWTAIPPDKVLKHPTSIDGEAYLCATSGSVGGLTYGGAGETYIAPPSASIIRCFLPPIPGF